MPLRLDSFAAINNGNIEDKENKKLVKKKKFVNKKNARSFNHVWLFATPWTVAHQTPLSMEFFTQENCDGLPIPTPGDLPDPGNEL